MRAIKAIIILCLVLGVILIIVNLPFFKINEVLIYGNDRVASEEILEEVGYKSNVTNYIFLNKKQVKEKLLFNSYIKDVHFEYVFPSKMIIDIEERVQVAYVPYSQNNYLYISREGIVLQTSNQLLEPLPIIKGVNFKEFTVGETLIINGEEILKDTVNIINIMKKYGIETKKLIIDISNSDIIQIKYNDFLINFGEATEIDKKVRTLYGILIALEERPELQGEIDLSNTNIEPILEVK